MENSVKQPEEQSQKWVLDFVRKLWQGLRENFFIGVLVSTMLIAVVVLVAWVVTRFSWPDGDPPHIQQPISAEYPGDQILVDLPTVIQADDPDPSLILIAVNAQMLAEPVEVTAVLPPSIYFTGTGDRQASRHTFKPGGQGTFALPIANSRTISGQSETKPVNFTASTPSGQSSTGSIRIVIEGDWRFRVRGLINNAVDDQNPLILLLVGLVTALGGLYDRHLQRVREEAKKRDQRRKEADETIQNIRDTIIHNQHISAREAFSKQKTDDLTEFFPGETRTIEGLLRLAEGAVANSAEIAAILNESAGWPEESAAAYLAGYPRLIQVDPVTMRYYMPVLLDNLKNKTIRGNLSKIQRKETDHPPRHWPPDIHQKKKSSLAASAFIARHLKADPFSCLKAEEEVETLFSTEYPVFWPEHDLYRRLSIRRNFPCVIYGAKGAGLTALAMALGLHSPAPFILTLYLSDPSGVDEIQAGLTRKLFEFLKLHPTALSKLSQADLHLLARCLALSLGAEYTASEVSAIQSELPLKSWSEDTKDKQKVNFWCNFAIGHLRLLEEELARLHQNGLCETFHPREISRCARAFEFHGVRLVLEINNERDSTGFLEQILTQVRRWAQDGVTTYVFLKKKPKTDKLPAGVVVEPLAWKETQLSEMVDHRYRMLVNKRRRIAGLFEPGALELLLNKALQDPGPPGRFNELWQKVTALVPEGVDQIGIDCVKEALAIER